MRHLLYLCIIAALLLAACGPDHDDMLRQLNQLAEANRADSLLTDDTLALSLTDYFDRHGSANERMMAHYLLGRTYADRGELPAALDAYHDAIDYADTTSVDCDYATLSRVHGQMADMLLMQDAPHNALVEYENAMKYANYAKDTIMALVSYEHKASAYSALNMTDSAISIRESVSGMYAKMHFSDYSAQALLPAITVLVNMGDFIKAKELLDAFESVFGSEDSELNRNRLFKSYYYGKGKYCLNVGKIDSAEYFFRKEIRLAKKLNDLELGYKGL